MNDEDAHIEHLEIIIENLQNQINNLTETITLAEGHSIYNSLIKQAKAGSRSSMDDFGAGNSSLLYLSKASIHTLKLMRLCHVT